MIGIQISKAKLYQICFYVIIIFSLILSLVDAAEGPKRNRRRKKKDVSDTSLTGVYYCLGIMALTIIPSIVMFFYSIYKDPMTPTVFSRMVEVLKERTIGYLSAQKLN